MAVFLVSTSFCDDESIPWKLSNQQVRALEDGAKEISDVLRKSEGRVEALKAALPTGTSLPNQEILQSIRSDYFAYLGDGTRLVADTQNNVGKDLEPSTKGSAYVFFSDIIHRYHQTSGSIEKMTGTDVVNVGSEIVTDLRATKVLFTASASQENVYYDLEVQSDPTKAQIEYRYDMDSTYQSVTGHTDRTVHHLIRALTHVKVTLSPYGFKEGSYDPGTEQSGVLMLVFR